MYDVFSMKNFDFPKDFLWGSSTAGHQIEGINDNSSNWYNEIESKKTNPDMDLSGMACNHYNMVEEDVRMLCDLGHKAYRMTIEWPRIQPSEGEFSEEATEHYLKELRLLKEKGIKVFMTLVHFTLPKWFDDMGGLNKMENFKYFEKYLRYILPKISEYVDFWNTFNEFNLYADVQNKLNHAKFHAYTYHIIKEYSDKPVSYAHSLKLMHPYQYNDKADKLMADYLDYTNNEFMLHAIRTGELVYPYTDGEFVPELKNSVDFWSINTYTRYIVDARKKNLEGERYNHKYLEMIPMKFYLDEIDPESVIHLLTRLKDKPVYISENGLSCIDDRFRIVFITMYLSALSEAIKCGVDVRGYLYWSLMDNYEWGSFTPRFGLVDVDFNTFKRTPKPSAWFYKEIIENNGFSQDILRKYLNELPTLGK